MTLGFLQIWTFLWDDLSIDLKQVIMNHKNKYRQMCRGQQKCSLITMINNEVCVFDCLMVYHGKLFSSVSST